MKRHPALQDYSRDHHRLLLQARAIRWVVEGSEHAAPLEEVILGFVDGWQHEIVPHLREEERVLLPFLRQAGIGRAQLARLLGDHARLRARVAFFRQARHLPGGALLPLLGRIGQQLHDHVRWEERELFQQLQARAQASALHELAEQTRRYREQHRPRAIGPRDH